MKKKTNVESALDAALEGLSDVERAKRGGIASGIAVRELEKQEMVGSAGMVSWPPLGTTSRCRDQYGEYNDDSDKNEDIILA